MAFHPDRLNQLLLHFLWPSICPGLSGLRTVLAIQPSMVGCDTRLNITVLAPGREFQAGNTQFSMRFFGKTSSNERSVN